MWGGANLNNVKGLASMLLKKNVRIGYPINIMNLPEVVKNPAFTCLVGLLVRSLQEENILSTFNENSNFFNNFGRLGQWFDQNL